MHHFNCICGSKVQIRNINNHFVTKKHINFLLKCGNLIYKYEALSRKEAYQSRKTVIKSNNRGRPCKNVVCRPPLKRKIEGGISIAFN